MSEQKLLSEATQHQGPSKHHLYIGFTLLNYVLSTFKVSISQNREKGTTHIHEPHQDPNSLSLVLLFCPNYSNSKVRPMNWDNA